MAIYENVKYSNKKVMLLEFGSGDICFSDVVNVDDPNRIHLVFFPSVGLRKIGESSFDLVGKTTDEVDAKLVFTFDNPESITVLIESFSKIKNQLTELLNKEI